MMRSLFAGVSGLQNHQTEMDVIGNNIANVDTVAFKAGSRHVQGRLRAAAAGREPSARQPGGINPIQVGLGMQIGSIDTTCSRRATSQTTGVNTDVAIQGNSFFVARQGQPELLHPRGQLPDRRRQGNLVAPTTASSCRASMADERRLLRRRSRDIQLPFGQKAAANPTTTMVARRKPRRIAADLRPDGPRGRRARRRLQRRDHGQSRERELVHGDHDHRVRLAGHQARPEDRPLQERVERMDVEVDPTSLDGDRASTRRRFGEAAR